MAGRRRYYRRPKPTRSNWTDKQRAAYWKKKYLDLIRRMKDW